MRRFVVCVAGLWRLVIGMVIGRSSWEQEQLAVVGHDGALSIYYVL